MNSADYVANEIERMRDAGMPTQSIAWQTALLCLGWAYVFGARGELCTPTNRRARYSDAHPTIKTACKNFNGQASCAGCKWHPDGMRTRFFDCRGFTYWVLLQVYGFKLAGAGATSQWNNADNWTAKGTIDTIPRDVLVCVFVRKGETMEHTGFSFNGETVECGNGVTHSKTINKKWSHWGLPKCVSGDVPPVPPVPPGPGLPTLRRGDRGEYVTLAQTKLIQRGFDCGSYGADGVFGAATESAVKRFQTSANLAPDGVVGPLTWSALDSTPPVPEARYRVTVFDLTRAQTDALVTQYPNAITEQEGV